MKKQIALAAFVAFIGSAANAADMPPGPMPPAYVPGPMPYSWAGFYIGGNAGGAWGDISNSLRVTNGSPGYFFPPAIAGVNASGSSDLDSSGFTGGGQIGYNFQPSNWVWGIEADIQSLDLSDSHGGKFRYTTNNDPYNLSTSSSTDWLFTLRGRVGYAFNRSLVYFTGGLAVTEIDFTQTFSEPSFTAVPGVRSKSSSTEAGWVIGGGWEYGFAQNWTLRGEYLFAQFEPDAAVGRGVKGTPANATFHNSLSDLDVNIVRGGLNYKF
jgi:outer membrane immunogenic protein